MKIGIDTLGSDHGRSGIGAYLVSLIRNLPNDEKYTFEAFGSEVDRYTFDSKKSNYSFIGLSSVDSTLGEKLWHMFRLNSFAKKQMYDAVIYTVGQSISPFIGKTKGIAIVQEIISKSLKSIDNYFIRKSIIKSLKKSEIILVASQFIRKDLISLGINSEKIEVIHNGLDHSYFYPHTELDGDTVTINPFSIKRPYFIYASKISDIKKNHIQLIKAFSEFKEKTGLPHRLVLAGSDGQCAKEVHKVVAKSKYNSDIFLTGYFPHRSLPEFYSCAEACIFPSEIEGVGLPIIEAMATGIPVICARAGALPEIAGDCAMYFNPENTEELANLMADIVNDSKKKERLIKTGLEWTKRFSWEKTAQKTLEIIENLQSL